MNKTEFIEAVAKKSGLSAKDAKAAVNAGIEVVMEQMVAKEDLAIAGFGTFKISESAARKGRNPQTGETIKIKASKRPVFKAGKALKEAANSKKKAKKK